MANDSSDAYETTVLRGEMAELAFMHRAAREGIAVAKPYGGRHPYDCLTQHKTRLLRIQVKATFSQPSPKCPLTHRVLVARSVRGKHCHYTREEVDFLVAFLGIRDIWYIIPIEEIGQRWRIYLYPDGRRNRGAGLFEQYREAWHLLKGEPQPADISALHADATPFEPKLPHLVGQEW